MTSYVFGYGSLLERASRTRTNPDAVGAWPARATGYQRGWFHQFADNVGASCTYLGAVRANGQTINGVVYPVNDIEATKQRETGYTAIPLTPEELVMLDGSAPPFDVKKAQVERDFGAAMAARPPLPESFTLYFQRGSTELTAASKAVMPRIKELAKARKALDITVVGHTDTLGTTESNEVLGLRRANAIARQMQQLVLKNMAIVVESNGARNLLVATPKNTDEPRNRRAEITVR